MQGNRRFFLGGNTARGFHSHHQQFIQDDSVYLIVLKGGPGVGKSTFMRQIAIEMHSRGNDAEHYHCSSDPLSLDAVYFPGPKVGIIDGTAPHVIEAKYPGVSGEIVNLGEFWNPEQLQLQRVTIIQSIKDIAQNFSRAYRCLEVAGQAHDLIVEVYRSSVDAVALERFVRETLKDFATTGARTRKLAVSAITPQGVTSFSSDAIGYTRQALVLTGPLAAAVPIFDRLQQEAEKRDTGADMMMCGLQPHRLEHLSTDEIGIFSGTDMHDWNGDTDGQRLVEAEQFLVRHAVTEQREDIAAAARACQTMIARAVTYLADAARIHKDVEELYVKAMDYRAVDRCRARVLRRLVRRFRRTEC